MVDENEILARRILRRRDEMKQAHKLTDTDLMYLFSLVIALRFLERTSFFASTRALPPSIGDDLGILHRRFEDEARFSANEVVSRICRELASHFGENERLRLPDYSSDAIRDAMLAVMDLGDGPESFEPHMLLGLFEHFYSRYVGLENVSEFRNSEKFSSLAQAFADEGQVPWEYFISLGEFSSQQASRASSVAYANILPPHAFLLRLRLWLRGIRLNSLGPNAIPPDAFGLICHPQQAVSSSLAFKQQVFKGESALSALCALLDQRDSIGRALVIIPGIDRSAGGKRAIFRQRLVESGYLLAVIDIPLATKPSNRSTTVSALLFGERYSARRQILCLDATHLLKKDFSLEHITYGSEMRAIAAIVHIWESGLPLYGYADSAEGALSSLIGRNFSQGYVDIPGLCKAVTHSQFEDRKFALRASTYINAKIDQEWLSSIDSAPILTLLNSHSKERFRAYIIGNNGAGKSLLLRELIKHLRRTETRAVGISFGNTDRFPFTGRLLDDGMFVYRGARTGKATLNYAIAATHLAKLVKQIHLDQTRLDVFSEIMEMLGFDRRHYLVPIGFTPAAAGYTDQQLEEFILLTGSARANAAILDKAPRAQHQLALMRQSDPKHVAVFDTLSSGEQQILTLTIKLIAEAQPATVFLIDEPEISLHVTWQRTLPRVLESIGTRMDCSMITATHSPVIISSATREADHNFVAKSGALTPLALRRSHSVDTVLFDDFETYTENSRRVHERCAAVVAQVISVINDDTRDSSRAINSLRNELQQMARIIEKSAESVSLGQKEADLDLVRKAEAAILEVIDNEAAYFSQESDSTTP